MTKTVGGPHGSAAARRKTGSHIHSRSKYTNFFRGFPSSAGTFFSTEGLFRNRAEDRRAAERMGVPRRGRRGHAGRTADRKRDGKRTGRTGNGRTDDKTGTGGRLKDGEREDGREDGRRRLRRKKERSGDLAGLRTFSQSDAADYLARHSPTFSPIASPRRSRATIVPSGPKRMICGMPLMP